MLLDHVMHHDIAEGHVSLAKMLSEVITAFITSKVNIASHV